MIYTIAAAAVLSVSVTASPALGVRGGSSASLGAAAVTSKGEVDTRLKSTDMQSGYYVEVTYTTSDTTCTSAPAILKASPLNECLMDGGSSYLYHCYFDGLTGELSKFTFSNVNDCTNFATQEITQISSSCVSSYNPVTGEVIDNVMRYCTLSEEPWTAHGESYVMTKQFNSLGDCDAEMYPTSYTAHYFNRCANNVLIHDCYGSVKIESSFNDPECETAPHSTEMTYINRCNSINDGHYESEMCVKPELNSEDDDDDSIFSVCFSADSLVALVDGSSKRMADVQVGDRIQTLTSSGETDFSDVAFVVHEPNAMASRFVTLRTATGQALKVTPEHVLPAGTCAPKASLSAMPLVPASAVRVGDCVYTPLGQQKVVFTATTEGNGVYSVVTTEMSGLLVVDGIAASSFGTSQHAVVNAYYHMHRMVYSVGLSVLTNNLVVQRANAFLGETALSVGRVLKLL